MEELTQLLVQSEQQLAESGLMVSSTIHVSQINISTILILDYGSSEEEEIEEARPRVGKKKRGDDSDSGSDVSRHL